MYYDEDYSYYDDIDDEESYGISVKDWDALTPDGQEQYIKDNNIKVCYSTDISDSLSRGFGELSDFGCWEYSCKKV